MSLLRMQGREQQKTLSVKDGIVAILSFFACPFFYFNATMPVYNAFFGTLVSDRYKKRINTPNYGCMKRVKIYDSPKTRDEREICFSGRKEERVHDGQASGEL